MNKLKQLITESLSKYQIVDSCKSCNTLPLLVESKQYDMPISEAMRYHIDSKLQLTENIYRPGSIDHQKLLTEARILWTKGIIELKGTDKKIFETTDIGRWVKYEGQFVPLDLPLMEIEQEETVEFNVNKVWDFIESKPFYNKDYMPKFNTAKEIWDKWDLEQKQMYNNFKWEDTYGDKLHPRELAARQKQATYNKLAGLKEAKYQGKDVELGKPKRGGSKKFYVYVKDGDKVKKVSFGMAGGGLRAKLNNPKARRAFSDRHNCPQKKDKTKASYWSCRLPRYAKLLGFKTTFTGYW